MKFVQRLPQNSKESALFMLIVSFISVNIIAPTITGFEIGFSVEHWLAVDREIIFMWPTVIVIVLLTSKAGDFLASKILGDGENNFEAAMVITAMCHVFLISIIMSVVGAWLGTGHISMKPITGFFYNWPRNFTIALFTETVVAQPIARSVMSLIHSRSNETVAATD